MNTNKILIAGLVGGVVAFILGFLLYGLALSGFFEDNMGSATGVMRKEADFQWVPMVLGHLTWGLLLAIIFGRWANISTLATGAKAGAVIGLLVGCTVDLINLGSTNLMNLTGTIGDIVVMTVMGAVVGGVVAMMLGRGK
ncbi:MAG: hypothetical protein KDC54_21085 [Lewinella sp.]|nr:hypothetical protein [Lewinella sp.]